MCYLKNCKAHGTTEDEMSKAQRKREEKARRMQEKMDAEAARWESKARERGGKLHPWEIAR